MAKKEIEKKDPTPDGLEAEEPMDPEMKVSDYASREEAVWAAREFLRRNAQSGLNRRLGIDPKEIVGVVFRKSWRNYFADGKVYGFPKKVAGRLVKAGIALLNGVKDPRSKKTAQDAVDAARARRAAKAAAREGADAEAKEKAEFDAELKAEEKAKADAEAEAKAAKKKK